MRDPAYPSHAPADGKPWGTAIHATAVAIGGAGLLIVGPSGSGKSRLASALIAASNPRGIRLVGDDRILLTLRDDGLVARAHPRIAGFIERRGLGLVACAFVATVVIRGVARLTLPSNTLERGPTTSANPHEQNFSALPIVHVDGADDPGSQRDAVLSWWRDACTTPVTKTPRNTACGAKIWNW